MQNWNLYWQVLFCSKSKEQMHYPDQERYKDIYCTCKMQWYTIAMLLLILLGIIFTVTTKVRKLNLFGEHLFSNVTKVMWFISDAQCYVPVKLSKVAGSIHLFKQVGKLMPKYVTLKKNWIWDVLEIDRKEVSVILHGNNINLPTSVILLLRDKFRNRWHISREPLLLYIMLKQGRMWFSLEHIDREEEAAVTAGIA